MREKALAATAAAAVALLGAGSAQPRPHAAAKALPLLGIVTNPSGQSLVRVDPVRLRPLPGARIKLGDVGGWAFRGARLALGRWDPSGESFWTAEASIRLVNPYTMTPAGEIPLGKGPLDGSALAWLAPDRIVALALNCCSEDHDLVVADPVAERVVERRALHIDSIQELRAGDRLVVLAAPQQGIGAVSVLAIDANGEIERTVLERIQGGTERIREGEDAGINDLRPALTVDGDRAFVFSPSGLAAEVDLSSLKVQYHLLVHGHLGTRTAAKRYIGSSVWAQTLPDGLVAVTGSSSRPYVDKDGNEQILREPSGLELVDTRDWSVRSIDPTADSFAFASDRLLTRDLLLATGSRWDSGQEGGSAPSGVSVYALDGQRLFRLFKHRRAAVDFVYRNRAYVNVESGVLRVVNLGSGRVVGKRDYKTIPWLITP